MRVAVLVGGPSPEGEGSFTSAEPAARALTAVGHDAVLLDMSDPTFWQKLPDTDIAFIAGHGWYAEDGKLQGLLEMLRFPYTGSGVLASALGMHKPTFKRLVAAHGIPTLPFTTLRRGTPVEAVESALDGFEFPVFVKPASSGDSFDSGIARGLDDVVRVLTDRGRFVVQEFLVEPYLPTTTMTVGVVDVDGAVQTFPVLEAVPKKEFYDNEAKNDPTLTEYLCPAPIPDEVAELVRATAREVFDLCGCHGVGRVDFMMSPDGPVVLELNTLPGLAPTGNLAAGARAAGLDYERLIEAVLVSGLRRAPGYHP